MPRYNSKESRLTAEIFEGVSDHSIIQTSLKSSRMEFDSDKGKFKKNQRTSPEDNVVVFRKKKKTKFYGSGECVVIKKLPYMLSISKGFYYFEPFLNAAGETLSTHDIIHRYTNKFPRINAEKLSNPEIYGEHCSFACPSLKWKMVYGLTTPEEGEICVVDQNLRDTTTFILKVKVGVLNLRSNITGFLRAHGYKKIDEFYTRQSVIIRPSLEYTEAFEMLQREELDPKPGHHDSSYLSFPPYNIDCDFDSFSLSFIKRHFGMTDKKNGYELVRLPGACPNIQWLHDYCAGALIRLTPCPLDQANVRCGANYNYKVSLDGFDELKHRPGIIHKYNILFVGESSFNNYLDSNDYVIDRKDAMFNKLRECNYVELVDQTSFSKNSQDSYIMLKHGSIFRVVNYTPDFPLCMMANHFGTDGRNYYYACLPGGAPRRKKGLNTKGGSDGANQPGRYVRAPTPGSSSSRDDSQSPKEPTAKPKQDNKKRKPTGCKIPKGSGSKAINSLSNTVAELEGKLDAIQEQQNDPIVSNDNPVVIVEVQKPQEERTPRTSDVKNSKKTIELQRQDKLRQISDSYLDEAALFEGFDAHGLVEFGDGMFMKYSKVRYRKKLVMDLSYYYSTTPGVLLRPLPANPALARKVDRWYVEIFEEDFGWIVCPCAECHPYFTGDPNTNDLTTPLFNMTERTHVKHVADVRSVFSRKIEVFEGSYLPAVIPKDPIVSLYRKLGGTIRIDQPMIWKTFTASKAFYEHLLSTIVCQYDKLPIIDKLVVDCSYLKKGHLFHQIWKSSTTRFWRMLGFEDNSIDGDWVITCKFRYFYNTIEAQALDNTDRKLRKNDVRIASVVVEKFGKVVFKKHLVVEWNALNMMATNTGLLTRCVNGDLNGIILNATNSVRLHLRDTDLGSSFIDRNDVIVSTAIVGVYKMLNTASVLAQASGSSLLK